jgi:hypothetical protein
MSANKRPPKELAKYVVQVTVKDKESRRDTFQYFQTQKMAKEWAKAKTGTKKMFKIMYDFYETL